MNYEQEKQYAYGKHNGLSGLMPSDCCAGTPVLGNGGSIAEDCIKQLTLAQERLSTLSLNLRDKLEPVCKDSYPKPECVSEKVPTPYPPLFNEIREMTRRLHETANRFEDIFERCAL
jgi:hypothetical protein